MKVKNVLLMLLLALSAGCGKRVAELPQENSVYYWRTDWRLDSVALSFMDRYHISKVYCRYFDVVMTDSLPMPNATITFSEPVSAQLHIVPTVQINETNDVGGVSELQIDCDYTSRSRATYYDFLNEVRREAQKHGLRLSTTIRLHQLSMPVPPVDYGVLMLYNTGDPRKFQQRNPVLDLRDVQPYLHRLADYDLPLAAAYPVYRWQRTIYGVRIEHTVEASELLRVKKAVEKQRPSLSRSIITYHLDKENINRYKPEDYEAIYHH